MTGGSGRTMTVRRIGILSLLVVGAIFTGHHPATALESMTASLDRSPAQVTGPLDRLAGVQFQDVSPAEALALLRDRAGVRIVFSPSQLAEPVTVACDCRRRTVGSTLEGILENSGFTFTLVGEQIVVEPEGPAAPESTPDEVEEAILTGTIRDAERGEPVAGALVSLLGAGSGLHRSTLTGPSGRYTFELPEPGEWSIQVVRLGYAESESGRVVVEAGETRVLDLTIVTTPIELDPVRIDAEASRVCRRLDPDEGSLLARLWYEARTTLRVVAWAEEEARYHFVLHRWKRTTDLTNRRVVAETHGERTRSIRPFETAPISELLEHGWVRATDEEDVYVYYGLDARTLLSAEFESAYCFELQRDPATADRVGIAFEPAWEREVAGVRGVLWLDAETAALESLDFYYTRHPHEPPIPAEISVHFNGRAEFRPLPDGGWVVERWMLRLPEYQVLVVSGHRSIGARERAFSGEFYEAIEAQPRWWRDIAREARLGMVEVGGTLLGIRVPDGTHFNIRALRSVEEMAHDAIRRADDRRTTIN
jgi:hypothetical protein